MRLSAEMSILERLDGEMCIIEQLDGELGIIQRGADVDPYQGEYTVVSLVEDEQTLNTKRKFLLENVTVLRIPYQETGNLYGETVFIGNNY